ncbi:MAG: peptidoglycan DD-metalloendopeptidase family protein [Saprospiraceae bacterium]|nr:peptidoglycan DD-metalloendopeptidase family protein [Saprospiraceae bacterium]
MAASLSLGSALDFGANYLMAPLADSTSSASAIWDFADWETRRFNPYKAEDVKFPIQIDFADSTFALPMARKMVVTSRYGWRNGELHRGIDLDLITGDDVYALLGGKVRYVKYHTGHGKTVVIRHANGLETVYAHLSKQLVKVNDIVKKGHLIGKGGTSGNARGSHLHLEVRFQGRTLNPESFFDFTKSDHIRAKRLWVTKAYANPRNYSSVRPSRLPVLTNYPTPKIEKPKSEVAVKEKPIPREGADQSIQPKKEIPIEVASQEPKRLSINGNVKYNQKNPYVIKYGDTLYSLARAHHTTVDGICKENGIPDAFKIKVGQKVILDF